VNPKSGQTAQVFRLLGSWSAIFIADLVKVRPEPFRKKVTWPDTPRLRKRMYC
jgi:hypothetical protein